MSSIGNKICDIICKISIKIRFRAFSMITKIYPTICCLITNPKRSTIPYIRIRSISTPCNVKEINNIFIFIYRKIKFVILLYTIYNCFMEYKIIIIFIYVVIITTCKFIIIKIKITNTNTITF